MHGQNHIKDIVQIRPLLRHNLYSELKKKLDVGGQLRLKLISEFIYFVVVYLNECVSGWSNKTTNGGINVERIWVEMVAN